MISHGVEQDQAACDAPFSPEYAISGMRPSSRTSRPTPLMIAMELVSFLVVENLGDGESMRELNADARRSCGGIGGIERDAACVDPGGFFWRGRGWKQRANPRWGAVLLLFCRRVRTTGVHNAMRCIKLGRNLERERKKILFFIVKSLFEVTEVMFPIFDLHTSAKRDQRQQTTDKIERHAPIFSTSTPPNHPTIHPSVHP